jgi:hypothetical protein
MPSIEVRTTAQLLLIRLVVSLPPGESDHRAAYDATMKLLGCSGIFKGLVGAFVASVAIPQRDVNSKAPLPVPLCSSLSLLVCVYTLVCVCVAV